ncbi:MAG: four helix bundle protein [Chthoniobacterales bacterium]
MSRTLIGWRDENSLRGRIKTLEDLECWKQCRTLQLFVAKKVVPQLPPDERYRLGDQLLRAARSTTSNIAEGYGRFHYLDNAKFCSNARGSCWEVLDHLITGDDEEIVRHEVLSERRDLVNHSVRLLNGYMNYLKRAQKSPDSAPTPDNR